MILLELLFCVGLGKFFWDQHKSSAIVGILSALLVPKADPSKHSKATRTASNTLVLDYLYDGQVHELVLPARRKKLHWAKCMSISEDGMATDVTNFVRSRAGPFGDFFGLTLESHQVCRGSTRLEVWNAQGELVLVFA
jgi:hypothetical protein